MPKDQHNALCFSPHPLTRVVVIVKLKHKPSLLDRLAAKRFALTALAAHLCLVELKAMRAKEEDWNTLHSRLVCGMQLARTYFDDAAVCLVLEALQALSQIHASVAGREDQWFVTPAEAQVLGMALVVTDDMEALCTSQELHKSYVLAATQL